MSYRSSRRDRSLSACLGAGLFGAALSSTGCEWVLGGVPRELAPVDASLDAAAEPDRGDASSLRDAGPRPDAGSVVMGDAGGAGPDDAGGLSEREGGEPVDAAPNEPCVPDAGAIYYADDDGDGFGRDDAELTGCPPAGGGWSTRGGDCNDQRADVFPGQPAYFDKAYPVDGVDSFDYDCSGAETGNGKQPVFLGCGLLDLLVCVGQGYAATGRNGVFQNATCGSEVYQDCQAVVLGTAGCASVSEVRKDRYLCH